MIQLILLDFEPHLSCNVLDTHPLLSLHVITALINCDPEGLTLLMIMYM